MFGTERTNDSARIYVLKRELAEMRRQATNERKGLLSRLMGKKEP